jgi:hypothetical protein
MPITNGYLHDGAKVVDVVYGYNGTPPAGQTFVAMSDPSRIGAGQSLAAAAACDAPIPMLLNKLVAKNVLSAAEADDVRTVIGDYPASATISATADEVTKVATTV